MIKLIKPPTSAPASKGTASSGLCHVLPGFPSGFCTHGGRMPALQSSALRQSGATGNHSQTDCSPRSAGHETALQEQLGTSIQSAGPGGSRDAVNWPLSASDTLPLSPVCPPPGSPPLLEHNAHSQLRTHVVSADPLPTVPDRGIPPHVPDLDGVPPPEPLSVTWAQVPPWSLAAGVGVWCPPPWSTRLRGGAAPRDGGRGRCSLTRSHQRPPGPR